MSITKIVLLFINCMYEGCPKMLYNCIISLRLKNQYQFNSYAPCREFISGHTVEIT